VKFLIDAQMPMRLVGWLRQHGHDTLHTLDLPLGNRTPDSEVVARATRDGRIVVSKDSDFVQSFLLTGQPALLLVSTGNVSNVELEGLIHRNLAAIEQAFVSARYVEVTRSTLIVHE
jgi:predicted nuclease of predicted toxin-antitoxin system